MWFKVDYVKLVTLLTPTFLRGKVLQAFIRVLVLPINTLHAQWRVRRTENLYRLGHSGQVCYLRKVLNDGFDNELRRIIIADGNIYREQYIYTQGEEQKKYLGKIFLRPASEYGDAGVDFRVFVPPGFNLPANYYQMKAVIDYYKLAGKRYRIQFENE